MPFVSFFRIILYSRYGGNNMLFNNDKKNLPEDISGQRIELSLDDLNQVTGGISFEEYNKRLKLLDQQNWASRDDYVDAVNKLIIEYKG